MKKQNDNSDINEIIDECLARPRLGPFEVKTFKPHKHKDEITLLTNCNSEYILGIMQKCPTITDPHFLCKLINKEAKRTAAIPYTTKPKREIQNKVLKFAIENPRWLIIGFVLGIGLSFWFDQNIGQIIRMDLIGGLMILNFLVHSERLKIPD